MVDVVGSLGSALPLQSVAEQAATQSDSRTIFVSPGVQGIPYMGRGCHGLGQTDRHCRRDRRTIEQGRSCSR